MSVLYLHSSTLVQWLDCVFRIDCGDRYSKGKLISTRNNQFVIQDYYGRISKIFTGRKAVLTFSTPLCSALEMLRPRPWAQDVNWMCIRRSLNILGIFETSQGGSLFSEFQLREWQISLANAFLSISIWKKWNLDYW